VNFAAGAVPAAVVETGGREVQSRFTADNRDRVLIRQTRVATDMSLPATGADRGMSPVVGVALLVGIVLLLAAVFGGLAFGFAERLDGLDTVETLDDEACPGFRVVAYEPPSFDGVNEQLSRNNCALWLRAGNVETDASGRVTRWLDAGPNGFHATQSDPAARPTLVSPTDADIDHAAVEFQGANEDTTNPDETDGQVLRLDRDVSELNVEADTGLVIAAVVRTDSFNRGGTWTVGEAGVDGREFSMRTCSAYSMDTCSVGGDASGHWRAQHWGTADVDFESQATDQEWAVLVHAYDGETAAVRVNGQPVAAESVDLSLDSNRDVQIGRWEREEGDPYWYYDGRMAELLIFDQSLSDEEVANVEGYLMTKFDVEE
jgi:flagellin-like protein